MKNTSYSRSIAVSVLLSLIVTSMLSLTARAQTTTTSTTTVTTTPAVKNSPAVTKPVTSVPAEYRISREDTLVITCLNSQEYSIIGVVLPDGTISYPKMGQIYVVGMTLHQLETKIAKFLKKEFVKPQISVAVRERQVRQVSVVGTGLKNTGKRVMRDNWKVLDAIADTGGLLSDRTELFTGKLIRLETGETIPLDLPAILNNDPKANMLLETNDVIIIDAVPENQSQVQISGEVNKPGFILIPRDGSVGKALEAAGGPRPTAQLSQSVIERGGTKIPLDLRRMVMDGTEPEGVRLQPGDKLVIPENKRLFYVVGAVGRQGAMVLPDDRPMTVTRALSDAGIQLPNAESKKTALTRIKPDGTQETQIVNVEGMLSKNDYSQDVVLQPGDQIYVPFKKGRGFRAQDAFSFLGVVPGLRYILNGFHY